MNEKILCEKCKKRYVVQQEWKTEEEKKKCMLCSIREKLISEKLKDLSPREQKVIIMRFGIENGITHTLEEVGKEFGVTRERIRQIEAKALCRLKINC